MTPNGPGQSALLLLDVIEILNKKNILYAIVGAFAASFYGIVRASLDADAVISLQTLKETAGLCRDLEAAGFNVESRSGDPDDPIKGVIHIQDAFHNRVDLLIGIRGMDPGFFLRSKEANFMERKIKLAGLEDFIAMKIFAGSPKDIADVIGVMKLSGNKIDQPLVKTLVAHYGKESSSKLLAILKKNS